MSDEDVWLTPAEAVARLMPIGLSTRTLRRMADPQRPGGPLLRAVKLPNGRGDHRFQQASLDAFKRDVLAGRIALDPEDE